MVSVHSPPRARRPTPPDAPTPNDDAGGPARGRGPARDTLTLNDALAQALQGKKGVSIAAAVEAVLALGHKSRSKNFRLLVTQALCNSDRFERVGKALYALKA